MGQTKYKIVLLGDGKVGKTTWLKRYIGQDFDNRYLATLGVEVTPIPKYKISAWDCAGNEKYLGLWKGYYLQSNLGIIFYDCTKKNSYDHIEKWVNEFRSVCPNAPIIIIGTKLDAEKLKISEEQHNDLTKFTPHLCRISSKNHTNVNKPMRMAYEIYIYSFIYLRNCCDIFES